MQSVDTALDRVWPAQLRTDRLHLRPVTRQDSHLVEESLTDDRVRTYLGGPVTEDRVAARQAAYLRRPAPSPLSALPTSGRSAW